MPIRALCIDAGHFDQVARDETWYQVHRKRLEKMPKRLAQAAQWSPGQVPL